MSGTDDERLFREMDNLELFLIWQRFDINEVLPTRQETGDGLSSYSGGSGTNAQNG